ncbi:MULTISPECIES: DASS family sodium-coupled anion symporter [unclassified Psychrobacillus]|uniref:SLC13 family permease n=1 Tax=unclassified Psychrobacillus TaxID=2636677 RepID=UPI00146D4394|nr:DASS family sodium-coupled anion symporter [Psychrobacillus sp. BL-248-WT-3]NME06973.1 DASS family sodium-coupled anion symporter [Psychrobacillus sp. BL-248-WT-3]
MLYKLRRSLVLKENYKNYAALALALVSFFIIFLSLPDTFSYSAKIMTGIITSGIILWALEPIPMGLTGLIILLLMLVLKVADTSVIFSGFASPATYLIVAGMMLATAVNETSLIRRLTYKILIRWGSHAKGLLGSIIIIQQIQAFFIPTTAVRTALIMPVSKMIIEIVNAKPGSNLRKMIMLGVAYGGVISGTAVMTAAIGNILTVEILNRFAGVNITYFQWFLYTFPLWLILIPSIWILLLKVFPLPKEQQSFPMIQGEMKKRLEELGPVNKKEINCLIILILIVSLWLTEPFHGMHPSIPALLGVVLLTLPQVGIASWEKVIQINYNTVLLLSVTLSMGYVFVDSGAADIISDYLSVDWFTNIIQYPLLAVLVVSVMAQLFHKMISNVSTAVVILVPIIISVALNAGLDPLTIGFATGLSCVFGYMLVVESMSNVIAHSSGMISQKDFLKPGLYATIITIIATVLVAATWWKWIGLV